MKKVFIGLLLAVSFAVAGPASSLAAEAKVAGEQVVMTVNINAASQQELQQLPGVGSAISQRIIDYREQVGPFEQADDLKKVKGIGQKRMDQLRPMVVVE